MSRQSSPGLELFDPEVDDDDAAISEVSSDQAQASRPSSRKRVARDTAANRPSTKQCVVPQQPETDAEKDAEIAQLLIDRPGLAEQLRSDAVVQSSLAHEASFVQALPGRQSTMTPVQQRQGECSHDAQQTITEQQESKHRSKYSFVPSVTQRRIHALITALRHQGKSVSVFSKR